MPETYRYIDPDCVYTDSVTGVLRNLGGITDEAELRFFESAAVGKRLRELWKQPEVYDPSGVLRQLPSPISRDMREIYNYSVKPEGLYLIDRNIDPCVAGHAQKLLVDEALSHTEEVAVRGL